MVYGMNNYPYASPEILDIITVPDLLVKNIPLTY